MAIGITKIIIYYLVNIAFESRIPYRKYPFVLEPTGAVLC